MQRIVAELVDFQDSVTISVSVRAPPHHTYLTRQLTTVCGDGSTCARTKPPLLSHSKVVRAGVHLVGLRLWHLAQTCMYDS